LIEKAAFLDKRNGKAEGRRQKTEDRRQKTDRQAINFVGMKRNMEL
jgi:hypothetical protein